MQDMQQGGNAPIGSARLRIAFTWTPPVGRGVEGDVSAYLLTASGKVRGDHDMIFYNQPEGGAGAVRFRGGGDGGMFDVDLDAMPEAIERIVFCLTIDEAQAKGHTLALIDGAGIAVSQDGATILRFAPALAGATEAAMIFGELYRRGAQWKFRAVGQGFNGGLAPLAESFGIDIATDSDAPPPPVDVAPPDRIMLDETGRTITLTPSADGFGDILVTLTWSTGRSAGPGANVPVDLDLGCLVEMQDGRKTAIQALGGMVGTCDAPPFIALSDDDRTGAAGETLRIDGKRWSAIRRVAIFANVFDGQPDWRRTAGRLSVTMPDRPPVETGAIDGDDHCRICGILLLENDGDRMTLTRLAEPVADQHKLDERLGWGLRWQPGTKP